MSSYFTCLLFSHLLLAPLHPLPSASTTPEIVVRTLYDHVSFPKGSTPDWDAVRTLFIEEAVVVLRSSQTEMQVLSLETFIADFVRFIEQSNTIKTGFDEKIISLKVIEMGDIAQCFVIYEAWIPGSDRPPQQGVDSFQLIRQNGQWRIVSIINEIPGPERVIPEAIKN